MLLYLTFFVRESFSVETVLKCDPDQFFLEYVPSDNLMFVISTLPYPLILSPTPPPYLHEIAQGLERLGLSSSQM